MAEMKWYVLRAAGGKERKAKEYLEKEIERSGIADQVGQVLVPVKKEIVTKNGKRKAVDKLLFPGYVLVKMVMTDESWHVVRNVRGVTGFVGPGSKPVALTDEEVRGLGVEKRTATVSYEVGDSVRIIDGALDGFIGTVDEISPEAGTVRVIVSMFGRDTPVELELGQVAQV